jgi:GT2 family glycosyltransferase
MMEIAFPQVSQPEVSVIVVAFGGLDWTRRALHALNENTEPGYEVVIVDNGSTEEARSYLADNVGGATVLFNKENRGYAAACNQGASRAQGRQLVFLNNDLLVHREWLPPLLRRLSERWVGAVGPKILNLDGSLQSAGALVARSGSVAEYGFGQDPDALEFNFPRVVDYVSGACLAMRHSDLDRIGGFDPVFGRGYFEDVDLCFSLAGRGLRVLYEPQSRVTHVRGGSGMPEGSVDSILRNRATFERRWRHVLRLRPGSPLARTRRRTLAARDALARSRLLLVCGEAPQPTSDERYFASRLTILATKRTSLAAPEWLRRGAELLPGHHHLAERRFLYDDVIVEDEAQTLELAAELQRTQPQARHSVMEGHRLSEAVRASLGDPD